MADALSGRRVVVFGLGGTIAMAASDGADGAVPMLSAEQLLTAVPGLTDTGTLITVDEVRRVPGASLTFTDITALTEAIRARLAVGTDGVVVTQGTDTLEETAYLLDLTHTGPEPVVFTGAMRHAGLAGADGPANLLAAVQVAASPTARGQGSLVVMADEIHAARRVRKTHSTSGCTFQSPNGGPLGYVIEGHPRLLNRLDHRLVIPAPVDTHQVEVGLVTITLGDNGAMLDGLADRFDGLVIAAFGVGHVPSPLVATLDQLASRIPVVLASRTGAGSILHATYGFPGSESDLQQRGLIPAGFLDAFKARILLHTALTAGADHADVRAAFNVAGGYAHPDAWPWPSTTDTAATKGPTRA